MRQTAKSESMIEDDMRPEYDFSKGLRGVHAYRFAKLSSDEAFALGYWKSQGFEVGSFAKTEMRSMKTPDFRLSRNGVEVAICEVKSFQKDAWLDDRFKNSLPGELVGGLRPDPIFNRISNAVHTAFKQFESVNSDHGLLNFLLLVNHDSSARPEDLDRVLTGCENPRLGLFEGTCVQFSEGRIREEKNRIDLYVWLGLKKNGSPSVEYKILGNPATQLRVCELLNVDPRQVTKLPPAA